jgi:hypothetical protein
VQHHVGPLAARVTGFADLIIRAVVDLRESDLDLILRGGEAREALLQRPPLLPLPVKNLNHNLILENFESINSDQDQGQVIICDVAQPILVGLLKIFSHRRFSLRSMSCMSCPWLSPSWSRIGVDDPGMADRAVEPERDDMGVSPREEVRGVAPPGAD